MNTQSDILKYNHQIIYYDNKNATTVAGALLKFGLIQFFKTCKWEKIDDLKKLCDEFDDKKNPDVNLTLQFALNQLLDAIKITICFENFMKSLLLANGFVIHKLSKDKYPVLYKDQFQRPIMVSEIFENGKWEINRAIPLQNEFVKYQVSGVLSITIGMKELLNPSYQETFKIDKKLIELCKPYFGYRNNLHYYTGESFILTPYEYSNFTQIVDFVNDHIIRIHNNIVDELEADASYKAQRAIY